MSRKSAICLLVSSLVVGCANMDPQQYSSDYCRVETGAPCSALSGDGFCQPCPETLHEARSDSPSVR
jgi:hypothetical protein